jgi:glycosyltransferase involved in cell wall biosynthesis
LRERLIAHEVVAPLVQLLVGNRRGRRGERRPDGPIRFVLFNAFGMGGTARTVLNLAGVLAQRHDVEIVSLVRGGDEPFFAIPPGVRVSVLDDRRPGARQPALQRLLSRLPGFLLHPDDRMQHLVTLWTDLALLRRMRSWRSGVVVTTRPSLNLFAARFAPARVLAVAQEHRPLSHYADDMRREAAAQYRNLDVSAVLTRAELDVFRRLLDGAPTRVELIPNAVPRLPGDPPGEREKVVLAAGRMSQAKGFDLLIDAFVPVAARRPDWRLQIRGSGEEQPALERLVAERGLEPNVELLPPTPRLGEAMARAAVFALSSRLEGFGMVVIEAMSKGMAVVAFDCPIGPGEIIADGRDGLVVPPEDVAAFSDALLRVTGDEALRRRLGAAAVDAARGYDAEAIGRRWEALLESLGAKGRARAIR